MKWRGIANERVVFQMDTPWETYEELRAALIRAGVSTKPEHAFTTPAYPGVMLVCERDALFYGPTLGKRWPCASPVVVPHGVGTLEFQSGLDAETAERLLADLSNGTGPALNIELVPEIKGPITGKVDT